MNETTNEPKQNTRRVIKISRIKFIILSIIVLIAAVLWYMTTAIMYTTFRTSPTSQSAPSLGGMMESTKQISDSGVAYYPGYPEYNRTPTISDTREFLKTSYSATIKTRDVQGVVTDVKNIVKGADGRIDEFYSSDKSGRISFVVAKDKFDAFRDEMEAITHKKLYSESISSQNLLGQKQGIEKQTNNIVNTLDTLTAQRDAVTTKHNQTINSIKVEIARIQGELTAVRASIVPMSDSQIMVSLRSQETSLVNQDAIQRQRTITENNSYATQKQNLDNLIANYNSSLTEVNKQDSQFTDNIETVTGSVYVSWVSLWDLATIFSPVSPIILLIILIILAWIYLKHIGFIPKVEWK